MNIKKIISKIVLGVIGMTAAMSQCEASQGFPRMSDEEFRHNLFGIGSMINDIPRLRYNGDEALIKRKIERINATLEEYVVREADDFYINWGHYYFLEGVMRMLAHYSEDLSQVVKDKVPEILKDLYPDEDIDVHSDREAAEFIFGYIDESNSQFLGEYRL
jgi:hypothetical protein